MGNKKDNRVERSPRKEGRKGKTQKERQGSTGEKTVPSLEQGSQLSCLCALPSP